MQNFKNLSVWKKAHSLVLDIYKLTSVFPKNEEYRLTSQIIRSSSSIPTNIAEGCGKVSIKEYVRFINISISSASELEYQLLLARDLNYINSVKYKEFNNNLIQVRKMLWSLSRSLSDRTHT